ncbi:MAG: excinuclease ABC subunit UvrA, partial [Clostridia bacterium]|nr:excinuclease ABC subunit UvrA [Clostridia bacterium]
MRDSIIIKGAREHNLKSVDVTLPRDQLIVFTGLSGSGKSSLAFDTIYAEGQRRYVESMSSYARQFLGQMDKPDADLIEGLRPAIYIDQKTTAKNPRSTVGTVTEIHDYLRLMYARVGVPHCPECGREIRQQSVDEIVQAVLSLPEGTRVQLLSPIVRARKGEHTKLLEQALKDGFLRVRVDGEMYPLDETPKLDKQKKHTIEIVVDRLVVRPSIRQRLTDSLETAMKQSGGLVTVQQPDENAETQYSQNYACPECGVNIEELAPRMFSFNNPYGACPECGGLGEIMKISPDLCVPDRDKSLNEGAVSCMGWNSGEGGSFAHSVFEGLAKRYGFSMDAPLRELPESALNLIFYGSNGEKFDVAYESVNGRGVYKTAFEGVINALERRYRETTSDAMKTAYEEYMSHEPCPACRGRRLKKESLAVTVGDRNIAEVSELNIRRARDFFQGLQFGPTQKMIAAPILKEVNARLGFLCDVGLDYLTLSRGASTLSGGEAQRIRLATQIGSGLVGVLYILDEPSIGLHQRDNARLLATLKNLRDLGNTLIVVEHDEETLRAADYIVDIGPGAGEHGGEIVACGTVDDLMAAPRSVTGDYLAGRKAIAVPAVRRAPRGWLTV